MKKTLLLATLVAGLSMGQALYAMAPAPGETQQPSPKVQNLLKQNAEAIEQLIKQAKSVPALQTTLDQITSIRGQLDAKMKQYKGQNGQNAQQNPPADVQNLIKQNDQALDQLIKQSAAYPALKTISDKITSIRQQLEAEMKQLQTVPAQASTQTGTQTGVRKARLVQ